MADYLLPPEILAEIFSHLPPKSLLRFRSTSKPLKSIIDSHSFINLHLKNNSLNFNLILSHNTHLYHLDHHHHHFSNLIPLHHPFTHNTTNLTLIGSCNGLICISSNGEFAFWNPNIRKHHIIPHLPISIPQSDNNNNNNNIHIALRVHGFGFDPLTADYKLLRISWFVDLQHDASQSLVRLFSSKTNSWKVLPSMPYALCYAHTMGVFVEDSLHWIMTPKFDNFQPLLVVAFNLTLEIFNEVPLPVEMCEVNSKSFEIDVDVAVAVLGGCLCLIVNYQTAKIDVWVMKEYGCGDSWFKLFTLVESCFDLPLKSLKPLAYSSDGKKVLLVVNHEKLFWYDLKSEQASYVEGSPNLNEAMICVGSLVPPSFHVDNCTKKENRTSKSKRRDNFLSRGFKLTL